MSLQTASSGASRRSSRFPRRWWARPRWCGAAGSTSSAARTRSGARNAPCSSGASPRLGSGDTAPVSLVSGFLAGPWASGITLFPAPRSQFATLDLGDVVLLVGGMYGGAATNDAETLAAVVIGDSLGPFTGPVGSSTIAAQGGGTLVGPAGVTWRESDGSRHALVIGGIDLNTGLRKSGVWGF